MQSTEWRPVLGFDGIYEASDQGEIRRIAKASGAHPGQIIKWQIQPNGYAQVDLSARNIRKRRWVHTVICEAFHGPAVNDEEVCHDNGDSLDNRAANLSWGSSSRNKADIKRHGNQHNLNKTHCPRGHEYDKKNTGNLKRGGRRCLTCHRDKSRERRELAYLLEQTESETPDIGR